jgi:hypothetical protein
LHPTAVAQTLKTGRFAVGGKKLKAAGTWSEIPIN